MKTSKFPIISLLILLCTFFSLSAQVGVGTSIPDASSMLDVDVSSLAPTAKKGFLPPRMNETARDLISTPATGLLIYNTSTNQLNYYNGSAWQIVDTNTGFVDLTTNQTIAGNKTFTGTLIPSGRLMLPMGELSYFNDGAVSVAISEYVDDLLLDGMTKVNPSGVNILNDAFDSAYANSTYATPLQVATDTRLTYTGTATRLFHIALSFSFTPGTNGDVVIFAVAKNSVVQDKSKVIIKGGNNTDNQSSAMHVALWLRTGDYIEFYMGKSGGTGTIKVKSFNFFAMGM